MSREAIEELEFVEALVKRGFVNIPRMLFDYTGDLGLDYDTVGKLFALLACVGGPSENAFGTYTVSKKANPHDYDLVRTLVEDLGKQEIVKGEEERDSVTFSFIPLFFRLRAIWKQYALQYEEEMARGRVDPAIFVAEQLLGRPLSEREAADIQDWQTAYGYGADMVQEIIKEGQRVGTTRMSYLNQIARTWFEENVRTPEEARAYLQRNRKAAGKHKAIIQYLRINRPLTSAEQAMLDRWTDEWGFSNEVIIRAGEESVGAENQLTYINRVLESWKEQGVKTVTDADRVVSAHKGRQKKSESEKVTRMRSAPARNNVFLQREKKDDAYYDYLYKKFGE